MAIWDRITSRGRVEDRRALGPVAVGGAGVAGLALYLVFNLLTGAPIDVGEVLGQLEQVQIQNQSNVNREEFAGADEYEVFASTVMGSNNDMWVDVFVRSGREYAEPRLVLFRQATQSQCGGATAQVGPHYCPLDQTIYLDETFFDELQQRFGAQGGDVAEAYVMAHEVAHHVQNQLGTLQRISSEQRANRRWQMS